MNPAIRKIKRTISGYSSGHGSSENSTPADSPFSSLSIPVISVLLPVFTALFLLFAACSEIEDDRPDDPVIVNEVGYHPDYPKIAINAREEKTETGQEFLLLDAETLEPLYSGPVHERPGRDTASGDYIYELDFSEFSLPGEYRLTIPELNTLSSPFQIGDDIYNSAAIKSMESFYYQRCGSAVVIEDTWARPACHIDHASFYSYPPGSRDVTGGWHDAGDFSKFAVTTAVGAAYQLYLFDLKPNQFFDGQLRIPGQINGIPDLLDENRWGLEWLMKMQNWEGGVNFKVSKKNWTGEYLPHEDPDTYYIFEVSSTATATFAAVTSLAARTYRHLDAAFADRLQQAAEHSWAYLERNPAIIPEGGFTNPPDVSGGEMGDTDDTDERLWAAIELYRLTGKQKYLTWFTENYQQTLERPLSPVSWQNVTGFALYSYMRMENRYQNPQIRQDLWKELVLRADRIVEASEGNGYRQAITTEEYYWGSNSAVLGYAYELVQAYDITGFRSYITAALDQLHYILGRNPAAKSYVTGTGFRSVSNPYHQHFIRTERSETVPGLVVGGPNNQDRLNGEVLSEYPAKSYEDNAENYMVNEPAINYTSPFIFLAGYFSNFAIEHHSEVDIIPVNNN